jgi:geranylgeranyl diphosphate synthase, type I
MLKKIRTGIEKELHRYICAADKTYSLNRISPALLGHIRDFLLRRGKRIRPLLFILGYLGFTAKPRRGLFTSALSMELLHSFALIHDDIIDKSDTRRNGLSMHAMLNNYLTKHAHSKQNGQDMALIIGDILYAMGISALLAIDENAQRKEKALKKLTDAAIYTGTGEFQELLPRSRNIATITKEDIYALYDLKTSIYSFATPLVTGAVLAGAKDKELDTLFKFGVSMGRAFQIKDDLDDIFADLREGKITLLSWYAFTNSSEKIQRAIQRLLEKDYLSSSNLVRLRTILIESGAVDFAKMEIACCAEQTEIFRASSHMRETYKRLLIDYVKKTAL